MPTTTTPLRRIPTPHSEPPYDDQTADPPTTSRGWVQGSLALSIPRSTPETPEIPRPKGARVPLRLVPDPPDDGAAARTVPGNDEDDDLVHRPIPRIHRPWIARLAQALLEALHGERPVTQLLPWTSERVYAAVEKYATDAARRRPNVDLTRQAPAHVRSVRVSKPRPEVAEVCALVQRGPRAQAVALRLETWRGRWRCTAFELG